MEWGTPEERALKELKQVNEHLRRLITEQQHTNRLLVTLMQGLQIPDPQHPVSHSGDGTTPLARADGDGRRGESA